MHFSIPYGLYCSWTLLGELVAKASLSTPFKKFLTPMEAQPQSITDGSAPRFLKARTVTAKI